MLSLYEAATIDHLLIYHGYGRGSAAKREVSKAEKGPGELDQRWSGHQIDAIRHGTWPPSRATAVAT